jgi:NADH pyrophosphatase NudC (nudix superfamily)
MSYGQRQPLKTVLNNPQRSKNISHTSTRPQPSMEVTRGFLPIEGSTTNPSSPMETPGAGTSTVQRSVAEVLMRKRGEAAVGQASVLVAKKQRRKRTCQKCGKQECPGTSGRARCKSPCQDCKSTECMGREEKKPNNKCPNYRGE